LRFDDRAGQLSAGRPASLAVLSGDLREAAPHQIAEVATTMTLFEGETVYGNLD
jgi:predicted amidohydrolase YtcJ